MDQYDSRGTEAFDRQTAQFGAPSGPTTVSDEFSDGIPASRRVVEAVSGELEVPCVDLEPLYYSIDPESLDRLFDRPAGESRPTVETVSFTYADYRVVVSRNGSVDLFPEDDGQASQVDPGDS